MSLGKPMNEHRIIRSDLRQIYQTSIEPQKGDLPGISAADLELTRLQQSQSAISKNFKTPYPAYSTAGHNISSSTVPKGGDFRELGLGKRKAGSVI